MWFRTKGVYSLRRPNVLGLGNDNDIACRTQQVIASITVRISLVIYFLHGLLDPDLHDPYVNIHPSN